MNDDDRSDFDLLIQVTEDDVPVRPIGKRECHRGEGIRHRAFSLFLFDADGQVLLQQRSAGKPLWPGYWANSCCSHPRWGERLDDAVKRRAQEELGVALRNAPRWHFKFNYWADFGGRGGERELCHVYTCFVPSRQLSPNPDEVSAVRWVSPSQLDREIAEAVMPLTPWLLQEWPRLRQLVANEWGWPGLAE